MTRRLFFAFDPGPAITEMAWNYASSLKPPLASYRPAWSAPASYHVTVRFLGETGEAEYRALLDAAERPVDALPPLSLRFAGLRAFPSARGARVLALALDSSDARAGRALLSMVDRTLDAAGIRGDRRPWTPHLTLARFRSPASLDLGALPGPPSAQFSLRSLDLIESNLEPKGARYSTLRQFAVFAPTQAGEVR